MTNLRKEPTIYDYWLILRPYRSLILLSTLSGTLVAIILAWYIVRPTYETQASVLILPETTGSSIPANTLLGTDLSTDSLSSLRSLLNVPGLSASPVSEFVSILRSRTLAERVLEKVNVRHLPEIQDLLKDVPPHLQQRKIAQYIQEHLKIFSPDSKEGTLRISLRLHDRHKPALLVNQYVEMLQQYVGEMMQSRNLDKKAFLDKQLELIETRLQVAEDELLAFRKRYKTISLNDEIREYIKYLSELEAEDLAARTAVQETQAKLGAISHQSMELNPNWTEVQTELEIQKKALLKRRQEIQQAQGRYKRLLTTLPIQALNLARLERKVGIENRLYLLFKQQAEAIRIETTRATKIFQILDPAIEAEEPVSPARKLMVAVAFVLSLGMGILLSLFHHYWIYLKEEHMSQGQTEMKG